MNKLLITLFAAAVASVTTVAYAQAPVAQAPAASAPRPAATTGAAAPTSAKAMDAKIAMCIGCHGIPGYQASFPEVHKVPLISGQTAKYIATALTQYKNGDRKHPTMRAIAGSLSEKDINEISEFYAAQALKGPETLARAPQGRVAELFTKGNCLSCHGPNLSKPIDPSYPKIAGQHADYMFVALKAYKADHNQNVGRNNAVMGAIAKQFTNAELKALSNYVGSLQGELSVHPEPRFRR